MFRQIVFVLVLVLTLILGVLPTLAAAGPAPSAETAAAESLPAVDVVAAAGGARALTIPFVPKLGLLLYCEVDFESCSCGPVVGFCMDGVCCCD